MKELDGWAASIGETACRYLSQNGHDSIYSSLCYAGSSPAGWRLVIFLAVFAGVTVGVWRLFRPA